MPSRADQISKCDGTKKIEKWKSEEKTCSINVKVGAYVYVTYMSELHFYFLILVMNCTTFMRPQELKMAFFVFLTI